jgi:hypothetical protein
LRPGAALDDLRIDDIHVPAFESVAGADWPAAARRRPATTGLAWAASIVLAIAAGWTARDLLTPAATPGSADLVEATGAAGARPTEATPEVPVNPEPTSPMSTPPTPAVPGEPGTGAATPVAVASSPSSSGVDSMPAGDQEPDVRLVASAPAQPLAGEPTLRAATRVARPSPVRGTPSRTVPVPVEPEHRPGVPTLALEVAPWPHGQDRGPDLARAAAEAPVWPIPSGIGPRPRDGSMAPPAPQAEAPLPRPLAWANERGAWLSRLEAESEVGPLYVLPHLPLPDGWLALPGSGIWSAQPLGNDWIELVQWRDRPTSVSAGPRITDRGTTPDGRAFIELALPRGARLQVTGAVTLPTLEAMARHVVPIGP